MNFNKFGHTSTVMGFNKIFIFGGADYKDNGDYNFTNDSIVYDINLNSWELLINKGYIPSKRAVHSSCFIKKNKIAIYGGSKLNKALCSPNLYFGRILDENDIYWEEVSVTGNKPGSRYGHIMEFVYNYIIIFGGSNNKGILNDTWILNINSNTLNWNLLSFKKFPIERIYHSSSICMDGNAENMILVFGGRDKEENILNDIWGLRKHRNNKWEWVIGPNKSNVLPDKRFQHTSLFLGSLMFNIGGKYTNTKFNETIDIYDTIYNTWTKISFDKYYRHTSNISNNKLYIFGGLELTSYRKSSKNFNILNLTDIIPNDKMRIKYKINEYINKSNLKSVKIETMEKNPIKNLKILNNITKNITNRTGIHMLFLKKLLNPLSLDLNKFSSFPFTKDQILQLIEEAGKIIKKQPVVLKVNSPVKIFGDIHGQYLDLMSFFELYDFPININEENEGDIKHYNYIFLGDYVDRGIHSLETICLLLSLKCLYPQEINLIRGNHEDKNINVHYGFLEECEKRLNEVESEINPNSIFNKFNDLFEYFPLMAIVDNKSLCLHGGISNNINHINQVKSIKRPIKIIHEVETIEQQIIIDILWSDPTESNEILGEHINHDRDPYQNSNIIKFGPDILQSFLKRNNLLKIIRAHECVMNGVEIFDNGKLITVFSATDYCGKHKNAGAILYLLKDSTVNAKLIYPSANIKNWNPNIERPSTPPNWK